MKIQCFKIQFLFQLTLISKADYNNVSVSAVEIYSNRVYVCNNVYTERNNSIFIVKHERSMSFTIHNFYTIQLRISFLLLLKFANFSIVFNLLFFLNLNVHEFIYLFGGLPIGCLLLDFCRSSVQHAYFIIESQGLLEYIFSLATSW